jgi:hypothetical protein
MPRCTRLDMATCTTSPAGPLIGRSAAATLTDYDGGGAAPHHDTRSRDARTLQRESSHGRMAVGLKAR